jgi:hypothetical protein
VFVVPGANRPVVLSFVLVFIFCSATFVRVAAATFFRHHEKELEQRAEAAFPGPWLQRGF